LQPESLKNEQIIGELSSIRADLYVVAAYGLLLPPAILHLPRLGCINIHGSLLPRWRGAAPVQRALIAGDRETGVAIMRMEAGLDTGPVYATSVVPIDDRDTAGTLTDKLAVAGAELLLRALPAIEGGSARPSQQSDAGVLYASKLTKGEARLDWSLRAVDLDRRVRAYQPWPIAETAFSGQVLKIHQASPTPTPADGAPGTVRAVDAGGIEVNTGEGCLRLTRVQLAGRGIVSAAEFARNAIRGGSLLGVCFGELS
jgi:methionyl-tRNA formyltransferase